MQQCCEILQIQYYRSLFVCEKNTLIDDVVSAFEKSLFSGLVSYPYNEIITETFLATLCLQCWLQEIIFSREWTRSLFVRHNTDDAFLGSKQLNPFNFRKHQPEQFCVYRNELAVADSPIYATNKNRLDFVIMSDLDLLRIDVALICPSTPAISLLCLISIAFGRRREIFLTLKLPTFYFLLKVSCWFSYNIYAQYAQVDH